MLRSTTSEIEVSIFRFCLKLFKIFVFLKMMGCWTASQHHPPCCTSFSICTGIVTFIETSAGCKRSFSVVWWSCFLHVQKCLCSVVKLVEEIVLDLSWNFLKWMNLWHCLQCNMLCPFSVTRVQPDSARNSIAGWIVATGLHVSKNDLNSIFSK